MEVVYVDNSWMEGTCTLDAPMMPPQLYTGMENVRSYISQLQEQDYINGVTEAQWDQWIQSLPQRMVPTRVRNQSGVLNFVGGALNFRFGAATEEQVMECRRCIQKLQTEEDM
jgi:hypothetical protein